MNELYAIHITHGMGDHETTVWFWRRDREEIGKYPLLRTIHLLELFEIDYALGDAMIDRIAIDVPLVF
jgi:hypothetical protein